MAGPAPSVTDTTMAAGIISQPLSDPPKVPKSRKAIRPNYSLIHQHLLPVEVFPLPTLIPHNPVSLVAIALSYFTRVIASPPRRVYNSYFSSTTSSVHVTDHESIRKLWEMGFFGRGSLSRSEPSWRDTQKRKGQTAEENTNQRRDERRQLKFERAKKAQEEIAQQLSRESETDGDLTRPSLTSHAQETSLESLPAASLGTSDADIKGIEGQADCAADARLSSDLDGFDEWKQTVGPNGLPTPPATSISEAESEQSVKRPVQRLQKTKSVRFSPTTEAREFDLSSPVITPIKSPGICATEDKAHPSTSTSETSCDTENPEHLNLSIEEAFFLSYGLGVLNIYCEDSDTILSPTSLLSLFRRHSYHPARSLSVPQYPDDPFMLSYAVYHHYRSLGWVVRSGVKFSTDYLLYNRGPAFAHAEFAVVILPSYSHPYWSETTDQKEYVASKTRKSWDWLHGVNRVQAQVYKSLVLCYIEVPPVLTKAERGQDTDVKKELSRYTIRDVAVKRWTPNRTRD